MSQTEITIKRPDDWHVHLRDDSMLRDVAPATADHFSRAIVMPNLVPPITTRAACVAYRNRILAACEGKKFTPLMTAYLTDNINPDELRLGFEEGTFTAAKLYPAGATTNSESGVTNLENIGSALEAMASIGMPLLVHGEIVGDEYDVYDREALFIERTLSTLCESYPSLPIVFEHITSKQGVDFILQNNRHIAATITPHHLMINRTTMFKGGIRPHLYCLPIAKRREHQLALRAAATSGDPKFFLGTDSAPHELSAKENACGCAGIFNAPTALACYAQVFDEENALDKLEGFASQHGPRFYGLPENKQTITLVKEKQAQHPPKPLGSRKVQVFLPDTPVYWTVLSSRGN